MKFVFGDIVVVEGNLIGVVVKNWSRYLPEGYTQYYCEVYVRMHSKIIEYPDDQIKRYSVRHLFLDGDKLDYQRMSQR